MRPFLALTLLMSTLALAAMTAPAAAQDATLQGARTMTVTGTGQISVEPDMATVVVGIQAQAEDPANALDQASAATAAILARLDVEGIDPTLIRSGAIRLNPQYSQSVLSSGSQIVGFQAVNTIEVEARDLDRLGGLLAALVGDGANRLDRVQFGLQDPTAAQDEARRRAVADALRLADLYAQAAGVSVGEVREINEGGGSGYRPRAMEPAMMEMAASSPQFDVPVAPGQIELSASVVMVFAIGDQTE